MNKSNFMSLSLGLVLVNAASCGGNTQPITYTRQIDDPCDSVNNCEPGLICQDGICRQTCRMHEDCLGGYHCNDGLCAKGAITIVTCGNGQEDTGEQCDDGNTLDGDGCSAKCNIEPNYNCAGWPSVCSCAEGYQDSNGDGNCLKDCTSCGPNQLCVYDTRGSAIGCACTNGYQDSNSDGTCLPDCDCQNNQVCQYAADGSASCGCPEGTQDNDGNGTCSPSCATFAPGNCQAFQGCDDSDGTAKCECVVYVKNGAAGTGASWQDAIGSVAAANSKIAAYREDPLSGSRFTNCSIWLTKGVFVEQQTIDLVDKVSIIGGFKGQEYSATERTGDQKSELSCYTTNDKDNTTEKVYRRLFNVHGQASFADLSFKAGTISSKIYSELRGASIFAEDNANISIDNCDFSGAHLTNSSNAYAGSEPGGQIYLLNSQGHITNSRFIENYAAFGGAIGTNNSVLQISDSIFAGNSAGSYSGGKGGALHLINNSTVNIKNSSFHNNTSDCYGGGNGGAIYNDTSLLQITNSIFVGNFTSKGAGGSQGGAIYSGSYKDESTKLSIDNCIFALNIAFGDGMYDYNGPHGGAIYTDSVDNIITNSYFVSNRAYSNNCFQGAAGLDFSGANVAIANTIFFDNNYLSSNSCSMTNGIAIRNDSDGTVKVAYSLFLENNNSDSKANVIYNKRENGSIVVNNSLLDSDNDSITTHSCLTDAMLEIPDGINATWVKVENDANNYVTKIIASDNYWTADELKNQFVLIEAEKPYYLPITANGNNYVTVPLLPSDVVATPVTTEIIASKKVIIRDFSKVTDSDGSQESFIDQADAATDPQPTTDILGNSRPQGAGPDIGPFEIK